MKIKYEKAACFLLGALMTLAVALIYCFYQVRCNNHISSMHYEYLQNKGLDKNSPFVIEPAKDGSYTVVANSKDVMFNAKVAIAAEAWQRRTGIVFKIADETPKSKQGVIQVKNVKHYLDKDRKNITLGTTRADLGVVKTGTIKISQEANNNCGTDTYSVIIHELGHAIGVSHNFKNNRDIMSPAGQPDGLKQEITQRDIRIAKENHRVLMHELKQNK